MSPCRGRAESRDADELDDARDEIRRLRTVVTQLEHRIRELEGPTSSGQPRNFLKSPHQYFSSAQKTPRASDSDAAEGSAPDADDPDESTFPFPSFQSLSLTVAPKKKKRIEANSAYSPLLPIASASISPVSPFLDPIPAHTSQWASAHPLLNTCQGVRIASRDESADWVRDNRSGGESLGRWRQWDSWPSM